MGHFGATARAWGFGPFIAVEQSLQRVAQLDALLDKLRSLPMGLCDPVSGALCHQDTGLYRTLADNRTRNGHPAAQPKRIKPWETERRQVSPNAVRFGI